MTALYVEIDKFAAAWLRELIAWGLIAPGDVYEGSFEDLSPAQYDAYTQVHLCAGIGVWSYALRNAGWPDDRPVWTASFPCQPFSAAGKGGGFADERHLWPTGHWLIEQCRPVVLFGEQVASKPGLEWFDLVSTDLEGSGYAVGTHDLCAAGVGAPHIRQRLYFVADASSRSRRNTRTVLGTKAQSERHRLEHGRSPVQPISDGPMVDAESEQARLPGCSRESGGAGGVAVGERLAGPSGVAGTLQHTEGDGRIERGSEPERRRTPGFWGETDWIPCRDGKWRPVEPGTFPLAHGAPARVGRLRGYGNAIVAPVAEAFIRAYLETELCL